MGVKLCNVDGCNKKHMCKGYCRKHYDQVRHYGEIQDRTKFEPNEIIICDSFAEIVLYNIKNQEVARAKIDIEDVELIKEHKWKLGSNGYVESRDGNRLIYMHRLIENPSTNNVVDHINRNKLDNRKSNLRICTHQENTCNQSMRSNNTTGIIGVNYVKFRNKWRAEIMSNGVKVHLGYYENIKDAIIARLKAEKEYFNNFAPQKHLFEEYNI